MNHKIFPLAYKEYEENILYYLSLSLLPLRDLLSGHPRNNFHWFYFASQAKAVALEGKISGVKSSPRSSQNGYTEHAPTASDKKTLTGESFPAPIFPSPLAGEGRVRGSNSASDQVGQAMVEYAILVFFCVLVFGFEASLMLDVLNDYAQGFYYILQQSFP